MADNIQTYEEILNGASRDNRFRIIFTLPAGTSGDTRTLQILCKSATIPGKNYGQIELKHSGKTSRIKGDEVTDATWTTNFSVPKEAKQIYKSMDDWFNLEENYKVDIEAEQLNIINETVQTFKIEGAWVQALPAVTWDHDSENVIKSFEVTFSADKIITQ